MSEYEPEEKRVGWRDMGYGEASDRICLVVEANSDAGFVTKSVGYLELIPWSGVAYSK